MKRQTIPVTLALWLFATTVPAWAQLTAVVAGNSTSTNLANAAVFTGSAADVLACRAVSVLVYASHASAASGLSLQFSPDGANWDLAYGYSVSATTATVKMQPIQAQYFRVVYTNGATTTTTLRLQTLCHSTYLGAPSTGGATAVDVNTFPDNEPFNVAQYGGTAVGAGNAVHVQPGTAATFPVSGTFWQATQPVSGTFWQAIQPVSGTFWQATQPVSGTFWQATQPVSLATAPTTPVTGTFWQATQPVSLATMPALAAGTATVGETISTAQVATVFDGTTSLTVKNAFANIAASTTDGAVVAAVASKKLCVLGLVVEDGATATTIVFNSKPAGAGTAISMTFQNGVNGGAVLSYGPGCWFETVSGEGLSATTGAGSTTGVQVKYVER